MPTPATQWIRTAAVLIAFYQFVVYVTGAVPLIWAMLTAPSHGMEPGSKAILEVLLHVTIQQGLWLFAARWLYTRSERVARMIEAPESRAS